MILYIFNNPFPSSGGFSKRCKKEIEMLSETNVIVIICRANKKTNESNQFQTTYKSVPIYRFTTFFGITDKVLNYKNLAGLSEILRNLDLLIGLFSTTFKVFWKYKSETLKIYSVVSPLTVPIISYLSGFLFRAKADVIEFHDLEPELAMHIKKLNKNNFIMKVELFLEKVSCRIYKKIIVTSNSQAKRIINRTGVNEDKILIIPNSIQVENNKHQTNDNKELKIGYISSFAYEYNIKGLIDFIKEVSKNKDDLTGLEVVVIGEGELLPMAISKAKELKVDNIFKFIGKQENITKVINLIDIGIVPWEKDSMTETILPTKLFEYMEAKKIIIAPRFGEFNTILSHNTDALLYNSYSELIQFIKKLKIDTGLSSKLRENAYKKFNDKYRPDLFVKQLQEYVNS